MRDVAIAVWTLALWPLLTSVDPIVIGLALVGMVCGAWGAVKNGKEI